MNFWSKHNEIEDLLEKLTEQVEECLFNSLDAILEYIENGENEQVKKLSTIVHEAETKADEYRREIVSKLIQGALMPNTREDLLKLIENIDNIADGAEDVLDETLFISLDISELNKNQMEEMSELIKKQYKTLEKGLGFIFGDMVQALSKTGELEHLESMMDDYEEKIIRKLSERDDLELAQKMAYRDTITSIANLGDIIENAGDNIEIIVAVRRG
ncbi:MAG: DUF47 domain-containing protein [Bacillota bacterium]